MPAAHELVFAAKFWQADPNEFDRGKVTLSDRFWKFWISWLKESLFLLYLKHMYRAHNIAVNFPFSESQPAGHIFVFKLAAGSAPPRHRTRCPGN